jgi:hypothetical protein
MLLLRQVHFTRKFQKNELPHEATNEQDRPLWRLHGFAGSDNPPPLARPFLAIAGGGAAFHHRRYNDGGHEWAAIFASRAVKSEIGAYEVMELATRRVQHHPEDGEGAQQTYRPGKSGVQEQKC